MVEEVCCPYDYNHWAQIPQRRIEMLLLARLQAVKNASFQHTVHWVDMNCWLQSDLGCDCLCLHQRCNCAVQGDVKEHLGSRPLISTSLTPAIVSENAHAKMHIIKITTYYMDG